MTLNHGLTAVRVGFARRASRNRPSLFDAGLGDVQRSGILEAALGAGQQAADFELPDTDGAMVRLGSLLASGPVVVTFFRGGWCPYCCLQLEAYEAMLPTLASFGARLVAVSPQAHGPNHDVAARHDLHFSVLSDAGNQVARRYGLVAPVPQAWRNAYAGSGIDLATINGTTDWNLPAPGTFVVEPSGRIALSYVDVDYRNRLEPAEILAELQSLRGAATAADREYHTPCTPFQDANTMHRTIPSGRNHDAAPRP